MKINIVLIKAVGGEIPVIKKNTRFVQNPYTKNIGRKAKELYESGFEPYHICLVTNFNEFEKLNDDYFVYDSNGGRITKYKGESETYINNYFNKIISCSKDFGGETEIEFTDEILSKILTSDGLKEEIEMETLKEKSYV